MSDWPEDIPQPRDHHYLFAHRTLPQLVFRKTDDFLAAVVERGAEPLQALWQWLAEQLEPPAVAVASDGLAGEVMTLDGVGLAVLFTLPPPACPTEAYFTAAVLQTPSDASPEPPEPVVRYLTLERTVAIPGNVRSEPTVIGEWTAEGTHRNHGAGPEPTRQGFIGAIQALVQGLPPYDALQRDA